MQNVGLISESTYWNGTNGVVANIKVDVGYPTVMGLLSICIEGITTPIITVTGDEEAISKFAVNQWLDSSGVLSEWHEEAARYRAALETVDLPCRFTRLDIIKKKCLTYKLSMTQDSYKVDLTVVVEHDKATVSTTLVQDDSSYKRVELGEGIIKGPISVDILREGVKLVIDEFITRLRELIEQPIVETIAYT